MFRESQILQEPEKEESGGHKAEGYVAEFLEMHDKLFTRVERTETNGINDHNQIDVLAELKSGEESLPCAIDITGADKKRVEEKHKRERIMPFVARRDEVTREVISELMPHFIIEVNLREWISLGEESDEEGVPITDVMAEKNPKLQEKLYREILAKMWRQSLSLLKSSEYERERIWPYAKLLESQVKQYFNDKEIEVLRKTAA